MGWAPPLASEVAAPASSRGAEPGGFSRQAELTWLIGILALSLALRFALVPGRWINPDEGAHLMDGRLALDGLVPFLDFDARQLVYTYTLAGLLRLTNDGYLGVRFCLAALSVVNIWLVYLIARRLFDGRAAVAASLLYAIQPLAVIWAPIVHTEPVAIFPTALGVYCLVRHLQASPGRGWLVAAGICFSLAFYVRESSLAVTAAMVIALAVLSWRTPKLLLQRYALLTAGFLIPCLGLGVTYAEYLSLKAWWSSPLNPLFILLKQVSGIPHPTETAGGAPMGGPVIITAQRSELTIAYLKSVATLCTGELLALAASLGLAAGGLRSSRWREPGARPDVLLYAWAGGLFVLYGYWSMRRGFFPQYAEEWLPPLAIVAGAVVADFARLTLPDRWFGPVLGALGAFLLAVFAVTHFGERGFPVYACLLVPGLALGLAQLAPAGRSRAWMIVGAIALGLVLLASPAVGAPVPLRKALKVATLPVLLGGMYFALREQQSRIPRLVTYVGFVALVGAFSYVAGWAGTRIDLGYETVWPPATVRMVTDILSKRARPEDRVMSGAVIWEFEAGLRPFGNVSHPLSFILGTPWPVIVSLTREFDEHPPRFVILDGYTERTYARLLPDFTASLAARYRLLLEIPGVHYTVRVYEFRRAGPAS